MKKEVNAVSEVNPNESAAEDQAERDAEAQHENDN